MTLVTHPVNFEPTKKVFKLNLTFYKLNFKSCCYIKKFKKLDKKELKV